MKNRVFFAAVIFLFLIELTIITLFAFPAEEQTRDTVEANETVQTVQSDWNHFDKHINTTSLDYVVLDLRGNVMYRTRDGLSESMNAAISHKDTILDIEVGGAAVGKLIIYNNDAIRLKTEKQTVVIGIMAAMLLQLCVCVSYFLYLKNTVVKPFEKMKRFAERIAGGNLDIPLEMDRHNLFGAFTESFDLMRSELKKARIAEAKANASKKELVAKLSHDIKTPIASIKAASEVGAALSEDEKNRENYERIVRKTDQINTLVTNLFSATLEELNELSVTPCEMKSVELKELLENADYLHRAEIPSIPDCLIYADKLRLQQVFDNIFANSYKYADTKIDVDVRIEGDYLAAGIEDHGGGIDGSELPLLKEKFRRGSNTNGIDGAGLGLYISDYCMKEMRGSLDIENGVSGLKVIVRIALADAI